MTAPADRYATTQPSGAMDAFLNAPWAARTWLATTHVMVGAPMGLVTSGTLVILGPLTAGLVMVPCTWLFTGWQRARFAAYLGVPIQRRPWRAKGQPWRRWLWGEVRTADVWRQAGYHVVAGVVGVAAALAVLACWSAGLMLTTVFLHASLLPAEALFGLDTRSSTTLGVLTSMGVLLVYAAAWVARGAAAIDLAIARTLLEPDSREELPRRVQSLAVSRAEAVAAADAERRRIERDLHDGAQQRLVSLAMNLGIMRATLTDLPDPAREAITNAHDEAKQALAEMRNFVRGLHPVVLDDRGLDAALSGVVARSPIPVRLRVWMAERPSQTIEAIAYFVVSEALTNVAKHARATQAEVTIDQPATGRLRITVTDDGVGGARVDGGTGLRGLAHRVGSVDGSFGLISPAGGPTQILVDLPCES